MLISFNFSVLFSSKLFENLCMFWFSEQFSEGAHALIIPQFFLMGVKLEIAHRKKGNVSVSVRNQSSYSKSNCYQSAEHQSLLWVCKRTT